MMTATASPPTLRLLQNQFPEILRWKNLLSTPLRTNVTMIVPPPEIVSPKIEFSLAPFITDMKVNGRVYLIIVRGINRTIDFWYP